MDDLSWKDGYQFVNPRVNAAGDHVWPFDLSFPLEVQFWSYDRPSEIRMNRHDYFELILLESGEVMFQVQDRLLDLKPGDLLVMGSTFFHRLVYTGTPSKAPRIMFLPELICPAGGAGPDAEYLMPFMVQNASFPHVVPADAGLSGEISRLMRRIDGELGAGSSCSRLCARTYLKMILALLVKHYAPYQGSKPAFERRQRDLDRLRPVFDFIDRHCSDPMGVEDAASIIYMSKRNFTRFFKKVTGQTLMDYLQALRIERARHLLASTDKTIAEIALEVGFCNQSYFGTVFHRLAQMSAHEYRRQLSVSTEPALVHKAGGDQARIKIQSSHLPIRAFKQSL
ncbi:MAG: AraC family transcriptional regulator [Acidobacteria bacterium]|nr:AraC family transcriptional regulator [Acidobacteriota bacterium]MCI0720049.1 AraC family transcriptional regulator [Acidobacteriota bacterium]